MFRRSLEGVSKGLRRVFEGNKGILHYYCVAGAAAWLPRRCTGIALPRLSNCNGAVVMKRNGRILTPPPERRIHPAAPVPLARLPDESGVPVGSAIRFGGGAEMRLNGTHWNV
jgi:hypothetical protein